MADHGYRNLVTWSVDLWVTNVQSLRDRQRAAAPARGWDAQSARAFVLQALPTGMPGVTTQDYAKVDWQQISKGWNNACLERSMSKRYH